jgi:hypothetical protein
MSYIWFYKNNNNNNEKVPLNEEINKLVTHSYQSHRKNEIHSINFFTDDEPNIVYHVDFTNNTITIDNNGTVIVDHSPLDKEISRSTNSYGKKHKVKKQSSKKRKVKKYRESKRKSNKKKGKKM